MSDPWDLAATALRVLAAGPRGLGGAVIRMRASPDRDRLLDAARRLWPDMARISPNVDDLHLFGGVDVAATLSSATVVRSRGLLSRPRVLCLTMAERCPADLAAKLAQHLDAHPDALLLALDEGAEDSEHVPGLLAERLAFRMEPEGHGPVPLSVGHDAPIPNAALSEADIDTVTTAAAEFGIHSLRAPLMALNTAAVLAGLDGRDRILDDDLAQAAALVFSHRATRLPPDEADEQPDDPAPKEDRAGQRDAEETEDNHPLSRDMVIEAVRSLLPPEVLAGLGRIGQTKGAHGTGSGQKRRGNRRGRPLPSRPGRLDGRARLDLMATLRAAAPWQPLRRKQQPEREGLLLRPSDFRLKRYETTSDRLVIFAVDASGSAAISRLNEAKGAIELLLGQAYAARDHVALISFRGEVAECLLPPTRSLVQTKRKLSAMPGGGGTPLAAGLHQAMQVALQARSRGMTPVTVLLTDGKSNVALDGSPDRARAREDAVQMARAMRRQGLDVLVIDMSPRPQPALRDLAQHLDGGYLPLPRADAPRLSSAVQSALDHA
jgi:magnesium chelatase subunit D